jgi:hypothetical protein
VDVALLDRLQSSATEEFSGDQAGLLGQLPEQLERHAIDGDEEAGPR